MGNENFKLLFKMFDYLLVVWMKSFLFELLIQASHSSFYFKIFENCPNYKNFYLSNLYMETNFKSHKIWSKSLFKLLIYISILASQSSPSFKNFTNCRRIKKPYLSSAWKPIRNQMSFAKKSFFKLLIQVSHVSYFKTNQKTSFKLLMLCSNL